MRSAFSARAHAHASALSGQEGARSCDMIQLGSTKSILFGHEDSMNGGCGLASRACLHLNYAQIHFIVILQIVIYTPSSCRVAQPHLHRASKYSVCLVEEKRMEGKNY